MKKKLLLFSMLILSFGIFTTKTFAQEVTGGSADGLMPDAGGTMYVPTPDFQPPSFVLTVKRNNGNGHCQGSGTATLNFKGTFNGNMTLMEIAYQSTGKELMNAIIDGTGYNKTSNSVTYCLSYNIPPKNKLIFKFWWAEGQKWYWIPEM
ncbi:MAG: hypothetical protein M3004_04280 [Bacteroidota bacterium]|nr:hypothetical protein [Bacteroidota bacterium]